MNVIVKDVITFGKLLIFLYLVLNVKLVLGMLKRKMPYKDKDKYREYQKVYQKNWRKENPEKVKEINNKSESRLERKDYIKKWQKENPKFKIIRKRFNDSENGIESRRLWTKNNPEKVKKKYHKYYLTLKGIVNRLKKHDKKRFGIYNKEITKELIQLVNDRDKSCVYCRKLFNSNTIEYDHINPFKPFSKFNMVRCCQTCNRGKLNANVFEWCKFKGYIPDKIVLELFNKN